MEFHGDIAQFDSWQPPNLDLPGTYNVYPYCPQTSTESVQAACERSTEDPVSYGMQ